jgi:hypothetical protein
MNRAVTYSIITAVIADTVLSIARVILGKSVDISDLIIIGIIIFLVNFIIQIYFMRSRAYVQ